MAIDLTIYVDDQPGEIARLTSALGRAGVNIEGFCTIMTGGGKGEVHVLVEDEAVAFAALDDAGVAIASEQEVVVTAVEDRPGGLSDIACKLGDAGLNITLTYLATNTRLVFACDDLAAARRVLG